MRYKEVAMLPSRTVFALFAFPCLAQPLPDGLYAEIKTTKGTIVARLEAELTPLTVANFVGLAEGAITNAAFDPERPFFDGSVWHRVVPGHVIQGGVPQSERAKGPGYSIPNEIHARLNHGRAGMLNMANSGPHTNGSQWCITLGDRSYLDGDYTVFGEVVSGLDVVMSIAQGDTMESVRILRVGDKARQYRVTNESFQALLNSAKGRVAEDDRRRRAAEQAWIAQNHPDIKGPAEGVLAKVLSPGRTGEKPAAFRYRLKALRYTGHIIAGTAPLLDPVDYASGDKGEPTFNAAPATFKDTKINAPVDAALARMSAGERQLLIVPVTMAYGRAGYYAPPVPGTRRLVISPNTLLVYEIEALGAAPR